MKRILCTTIALMVLLTACSTSPASNTEPTEYAHTPYVSTITADGCFVCGEQEGSLAKLYWGQDNLGILNLNTFEFMRLEINRYDDAGNLIEEPAGIMQQQSIKSGESYAHASVHPDRGYADIQIQGERQPIDAAAIQSHLCQACLDAINDMYFGDYPPEEYAVINFSDKTIRPLIRNTTFFSSANYCVDCVFKDNGNIDLLIFYCPPRYQ